MPIPHPFHKQQTRQGFAQRLALALRQSGRSASPSALTVEFNARFKGPRVHLSSCRKWLMGDAIPTQEKLVVLAGMLGVTSDWLRFGDTTRLMENTAPTAFDKQELALLADFGRLRQRDQKLLKQLVGVMLSTT
jgi:hypothetical protein